MNKVQRERELRAETGARRGAAIVPILLLVSVFAMYSVALLSSGLSGSRSIDQQTEESRLDSAIESVALLATDRIWTGYVNDVGGSPGSITTFRLYLDELGVPPSDGQNLAGARATDVLQLLDMPSGAHRYSFDSIAVETADVLRVDTGDTTQLHLTVSARFDGMSRTVQQIFAIEPDEFEGFGYGLLANNVNCIFCHAQVDSVDRFYNEESRAFGNFDRVKVGTLQSLVFRHAGAAAITDSTADSFIAGSLYTRGLATDGDGIPISNWGAETLRGYEFDDGTGALYQDDWGLMAEVELSPADDPPQPMENLYLDYTDDYAAMVDGPLPTSFPSPIPDNGGYDPVLDGPTPGAANNRLIDDAEFFAVAQTAEGVVSASEVAVVAQGNSVNNLAELNGSMLAPGSSLQRSVNGHVILVGTESDPIKIEGTVAIDGDVVISGYVEGAGSLVVRGNVYIPGDLKYADGNQYEPGDLFGVPTGPRTFGITQDGMTNSLGIASGGSILIGDYQLPTPEDRLGPVNQGDIIAGDNSDRFSFVLSELALFNRDEWTKTQPMLPGPGEINLPPSDWTMVNSGYQGADYVPRYYHYGDGDTVPVFNQGDQYFDSRSGTWHTSGLGFPVQWNGSAFVGDTLTEIDPSDLTNPYLYNPDGSPKAVLLQVTPSDSWFGDALYKSVVLAEMATKAAGDPLEIDSLLYSNNAIFSLVRRDTPMQGQMIMNGALVAADVGVLVPGIRNDGGRPPENLPDSPYKVGLRLNYDERVKDMLNVQNPNRVRIRRILWQPIATL